MRVAEGLKSEALAAALDEAIAGRPDALYKRLSLASGLPGPRANTTVAQAFATSCAARGKAADALVLAMARLSPEAAPGATEREFLPLCGVLALGARAALDERLRDRALDVLHDAAEDVRFRVREAVPRALAAIGEKAGGDLVVKVAPWMDGFFQAAAVLLALADPAWLSAVDDPTEALARLDEAYLLARDAPRAAARWPGRKALVDALAIAPGALAARFGVPVFDMLARWSATEMPELRDAVAKSLRSPTLAGRHAAELARVRAALDASVPPPRDPTIIVHGTRGRGKKRRR